jgi:DNA (cytosine-5)-methyltransferase 1
VSALQGGGERGYRVDAESAAGGQLVPVIGFSHTQGLDPQAREEMTPTLRTGGGGQAASVGPAVRRLTPMECERLQGWPDGWTDIPWNGKPHAPDSKRYAAAGNGVTAPVAYWIAARLAEVLK